MKAVFVIVTYLLDSSTYLIFIPITRLHLYKSRRNLSWVWINQNWQRLFILSYCKAVKVCNSPYGLSHLLPPHCTYIRSPKIAAYLYIEGRELAKLSPCWEHSICTRRLLSWCWCSQLHSACSYPSACPVAGAVGSARLCAVTAVSGKTTPVVI